MTSTTFLDQLDRRLRQLIATVQTDLAPLELVQLNHKPAPAAWSVLECLEHLNRYSRYYNPRFAHVLAQPVSSTKQEVRHGWLGRKFIGMMTPENGKKIKTFNYMNPSGSQLSREVLTEFYAHQQQLLALLTQAHYANLNRKAVPIEFLRLIKLRLGEAFELQVVHEQRHLQQALRVKAGLPAACAAQAAAASPTTQPLLVTNL